MIDNGRFVPVEVEWGALQASDTTSFGKSIPPHDQYGDPSLLSPA